MIANNPHFWKLLARYTRWVRAGRTARRVCGHWLPAWLPTVASVLHVLARHADWYTEGRFLCITQSLMFPSVGWLWTLILLCLAGYPWGGGGGEHRYDLTDDPLPGLGYTPPSPVEETERDLVH